MKDISMVLKELKEVRKQQNISVKEVSCYIKEMLGQDVSEKTIYGWEAGSSKPDVPSFMALCMFYGITNPLTLFDETAGSYKATIDTLGLQRAINILTTVRDSEYVSDAEADDFLSDNMKTEVLYQLMDKAEEDERTRDARALKWAILQIERKK